MAIELPKDAEGREIPLDTVALFNRDGNVYSIVRWTFTTDFDLSDGWSNKWRAITDRGFALDPALVYLTTPEPDTWEKLEDDLNRVVENNDAFYEASCAYMNQSELCATVAGFMVATPGIARKKCSKMSYPASANLRVRINAD